MDKERVEQIKYNTEVLKNKVNLENKVKEQNAQLATRLLEEKRQNDTSANLRHRDKLKVEASQKKLRNIIAPAILELNRGSGIYSVSPPPPPSLVSINLL